MSAQTAADTGRNTHTAVAAPGRDVVALRLRGGGVGAGAHPEQAHLAGSDPLAPSA